MLPGGLMGQYIVSDLGSNTNIGKKKAGENLPV